MPNCKYCNREISKFDNDICPFCGGKDPIDKNYKTMDITQNISTSNPSYKLYKTKKMSIYVWLTAFLGIFGIGEFYIGFKKRGFLNILSFVLIVGILGSILFAISNNLIMYALVAVAIYIFYILYAFLILKKMDSVKDSNGEFLR